MAMLTFLLLYLIKILAILCVPEKIRYLSTEHPAIEFSDPNYFAFINLTSRRYGRHDPFYYVGLHVHILTTLDNNITLHFYFFEFLSNQYKRGFVEMHFRFCDLIEKDTFIGAAMRAGGFTKPCPYPPGIYHWSNMTVPSIQILKSFPFTKGRIYCNVSIARTQKVIVSGYIDMEIKEIRIKQPKINH